MAIDYAIEANAELQSPAPRPPAPAPGSAAIGDRVAALVPDAATLQLGIGAVPDAVLAALTEQRGLTVWSEMFSDGVLDLMKSGALDERRPVIASFAFGSLELYGWMDRKPWHLDAPYRDHQRPCEDRPPPSDDVGDGALQVDLFAQANAERVREVIYSGFGGQTGFVVGALHSRDGKGHHRAAVLASESQRVHRRAQAGRFRL